MMFPIKLLKNWIAIDLYDRGERKAGSIIIPDDDMKEYGIRPRFARVLSKGPDVTDVEIGDTVLIPHGDWTRKINTYETEAGLQSYWLTKEENVLLVRSPE